MYCPKCGQENPDDAQVCHSCGSELPKVDAATQKITPRISKLATAALALGILSLFTFGLTIVPAIVLGIISILTIEKSGGRLTGRAFAILGIVIPVLVFLAIFVVLMPALFRVKSTAYRMVCSTNLSGIGQAMLAYANDYDGEFPRSAGKNGQWAMVIPNWMAPNQFGAYGLAADG
ncbi:MAG: zinc-ribbon domain-containing protein, partial [Planctomycetota bacterium]